MHSCETCAIWLIDAWTMTHWYVNHDSLFRGTWLVVSCLRWLTYWDRYDAFMCVTWWIHVRDMMHSYVWHDSLNVLFVYLNHSKVTHHMTHIWRQIWCSHKAFMCVTWWIHVCDMMHSCAWHDSLDVLFVCVSHSNVSQTEETRLQIITTAKFATRFQISPLTYQTRILGSPQNFKQGFTWVNGVPVTPKIGRENISFMWHDSTLIYIHTYICICIHIYIHIYIYIHICICICIHISIYVCIYVYIYIHICIHIYIFIYVYVYVYTYLNMYVYIFIFDIHIHVYAYISSICIHIHVYTYIYIYTYTHTNFPFSTLCKRLWGGYD